MDWKRIQITLKQLGFDPGPIDGIRGRRTIAALKAFQASRQIPATGLVDGSTFAALFGGGLVSDLPWFSEAERLMGTQEAAGSANNPRILDWASELGIPYQGDDIPWCGLFVAHCIAASLPDEPLPDNPLGARNWLKFGVPCNVPTNGAVLVFWRGSRDGWQGHVGFYFGEDNSTYFSLGGNQSNSVNIARIRKDRLLHARWPRTVPLPTTGAHVIGFGGALSTNEA